MSFNVVGIEISSAEIKIIQANKKVNSIEIVQFIRHRLSPQEDISLTIKRMLTENRIRGDLIVAGISSQKAIMRNISLPFKDLNKIHKVVRYELESSLPYPVEEAILALQVRDSKKDASCSDLFIETVKKDEVRLFCQSLNAAGLDPHYLLLDCIALYNLYTHAFTSEQETVALVDIDEERALVVIVQGEHILFSRNISNPTRLELVDSKQTAPLPKEIVDSILEKIDLTLYAFSSQYSLNDSISRLLLTGKAVNLEKIDEYFTEKLEIETSIFDPLKAIEDTSFKDQASLWAIPLGLILGIKKNKKNRFNLRQEELAYQKKYSQFKEMALVLTLLAIMAVSLLTINIHYRTVVQQKKLNHINHEIYQVYQKIFPGAKKVNNELLQTQKALAAEKEKHKIYKMFAHKSLTHLQILKDLSTQISDEIQVEFTDLSIDKNQVKIKGIANSFEAVDRLKNSLQKIKRYAKSVVESAKVKGNDNKVDFRLSITVSNS